MKLFFSVLAFLTATTAGAEFVFRISDDPGTLDWGNGEVSGPVVQQLMEGLTVSGANGEPRPGMALSWKQTSKTALVFKLREASWSDGKPVCAQHFVDAWLRVFSPEFASPYAHYLFDVKKARARGCRELVVDLKRPAPYFAALASHWVLLPVRLDLINKHGREWMKPGNLVVNGPYLLEEWNHNRSYVLKRNSRYHGKPAFEEKLTALVVPDDSTALTLFESGALDWLKEISFLEKERLSKRPEYRHFPSFVEYHLGFRFGEGGLDKARRCALAGALEREQIPRLLKGGELPAAVLLPAGLGGGAAPRLPKPDKKLFADAKPLEIYYYAKDIHVPLMQWVQEQWRTKLGAKVKLVQLEGKTYWSRLLNDPPAIFLSGITAAYAHPFSFLSEFRSDSRANWGRFSSKEYDAAALATASARAQRILLEEECAVIPLYFRQTASLVATKWDGFTINPMTYVYLKNVRLRK